MYYKEEGIEHLLTATYTPQQNGVVDQRNHTVMNIVRILFKSGETICGLSSKLFFFVKGIKLDDRSQKMVYFSIKDGTKAHKLYDP